MSSTPFWGRFLDIISTALDTRNKKAKDPEQTLCLFRILGYTQTTGNRRSGNLFSSFTNIIGPSREKLASVLGFFLPPKTSLSSHLYIE